MRVYKPEYRDSGGLNRPVNRWYLEFRHKGKLRRVATFPDRKAAQAAARQVEKLMARSESGEGLDLELSRWVEGLPARMVIKLAEIGILDRERAAATKPWNKHLEDYRESLRNANRSKVYVDKTCNRITALLNGINPSSLTAITPATVSQILAELRKKGLSVKSSNHYLAAIKGFFNWMVRERRLSLNPIASLQCLNARADRRHVRRTLEISEVQRLLDAALHGKERFNVSGLDRYWLYRLAVETGLRSNELRSLDRSCFDLDGPAPTVSLGAAKTKNRRAATIPLRLQTAAELRGFIGQKHPKALVWELPRPENIVIMLRGDLKNASIPYRDDSARVVDFHALRNTFASLLLGSGVDIRTAKELMRHATINMTADVYACTFRDSQQNAVARLPEFSAPAAQPAQATGTDDPHLARHLVFQGTKHRNSSRRRAPRTGSEPNRQYAKKTGTYSANECIGVHPNAISASNSPLPPRGVEPLSPG